ncbi:MAG TPA: biotin transporter BioY [Paracoccaceae bacterium]|nr:biotin transporter BioY [Paracoccaceae bacterium]
MATAKTLHEELVPAQGAAIWVRRLALMAIGVAALWLSAKIQIATQPVPITLQVLVVMTIGAAYGSRLGVATLLTYLALGAAGEPVFAGTPEKGIGIAYMLGATGGYLVGFVLAAGVTGWLAERGWDRNPVTMAAAMAAGLFALYVPGVLWLCGGFTLLPFDGAFQGYGWENWYEYGVKTFLWIDALKLAVAVVAFPLVWRLVGGTRL